jgi:hypothetical protein
MLRDLALLRRIRTMRECLAKHESPPSLDDVLRSVEDLAERLETLAPRAAARAPDKPRS